jgi:hypothetical protein
MGALRGEPGGKVSLQGILKDMQRKTLETGIFLQRGPVGGQGGDVALLGTLRKR